MCFTPAANALLTIQQFYSAAHPEGSNRKGRRSQFILGPWENSIRILRGKAVVFLILLWGTLRGNVVNVTQQETAVVAEYDGRLTCRDKPLRYLVTAGEDHVTWVRLHILSDHPLGVRPSSSSAVSPSFLDTKSDLAQDNPRSGARGPLASLMKSHATSHMVTQRR